MLTTAHGEVSGSVTIGTDTLGSGSSDYSFMVALDNGGSTLWHSYWGKAAGEHGPHVAFDRPNCITAAGHFVGEVDLGTGATASVDLDDIYLAQLRPEDGETLYFARHGELGSQQVTALAAMPSGGIVIGGRMWGDMTLGEFALEATGDSNAFYAAALVVAAGVAPLSMRARL